MSIYKKLRVPAGEGSDASARFGMDAEDPIAVEIEQVMVTAAAWPVTRVQQRLIIHVGHGAAMFGDHFEEAFAAIGIHQRIDDDDELSSQPGGFRIVRRNQVVEVADGRKSGFGSGI